MSEQVNIWIDNEDPRGTAKADEDPRKTRHVHIWFLRDGKVTNHCIVPSRWFLSNYHQ